MAGEKLGLGDRIDTVENEMGEEPKKNRFFSEGVARILMFIAIGIIALLVSITVSVLTYRFMDRGSRTRQFPVLSDTYETEIPNYAIWSFLSDDGYDLRAQTADIERFTVSVRIKLGFDSNRYRELNGELTAKNDALMDTIRFYFSQRTREQLSDEVTVKQELMSRINSLLSRGEVEQVLFLQYQVIGF
ncbi:hypothetical protein S1OALGB6SA_418 [Olavius algarvensis spirochete endosymbiont]|uniref:flagellar basal body-associated FliL family protein n=1 Tax=Olavius algarvensis spirochete endosymbiont TaxID=260710 RepID=UPI00052DE1B1|nr:flagellar basal body-associated FliL family protein [Olavius algarvensis spirochete endosymbiont]KGM42629.1 hypothetical protein JY97_12535 [Alkalispirochaeta odontotermitis]VDA99350.1 hypothetical protein S1OALGB6SA_418 [Olavius algarvensis spirochete endosymbiont]